MTGGISEGRPVPPNPKNKENLQNFTLPSPAKFAKLQKLAKFAKTSSQMQIPNFLENVLENFGEIYAPATPKAR